LSNSDPSLADTIAPTHLLSDADVAAGKVVSVLPVAQ
jgi:hypothetical protein